MREGQRLLLNASFNALGQVVTLAVGLFLPPFVIKQLSSEVYGLVVVVGSALQFMVLLQIGFPNALQRYVAGALATEDDGSLGRYLSTGFTILLLAAVVGLGFVGAALIRPEWLVKRPESISEGTLRWVLLAIGIAVLIRLPLTIGNVSLQATQRFGLMNAVNSTGALARVALVVTVLTFLPGNVVGYAVATSAATLLPGIVFFWMGRRLIPQGRISLRLWSRAALRDLMKYGGEVALIPLSWMLYVQAVYVVMGRMLGPEQVAIFSLAMLWGGALRNAVGFAGSVALPAAARRQAKGESEAVRSMVLAAIKYSLMAGLLPSVLLGVFRFSLVELWLGPGFDQVAEILLPLVLAQLVGGAMSGGNSVFIGIGRVRPLTVTNAVFAPATPILAYVAMSVFGGDLITFAWLYLALFIVRSIGVLPMLIASAMELSPWSLYLNAVCRPCLAAGAFAGTALAVEGTVSVETWYHLLGVFALLGSIYPILLYALAFDSLDRRLVRGLMESAWGAMRGVRVR